MLTLQSNKEIRINKGDSGMAPLFINIGDNLRPIGYEFNIPIDINIVSTLPYVIKFLHYNDGAIARVDEQDHTLYLTNMDSNTPELNIIFYEDTWREKVINAGYYHIWQEDSDWLWDAGTPGTEEVIDISKYGFVFPGNGVIVGGIDMHVNYQLITNNSCIYFEMWPILENPQVPLLTKKITPSLQLVETYMNDNLLYSQHTNTVNSYGEILLKFNPEDTETIERGKYLYQLRSYLYNSYSDVYDVKTIINRTPFYVIDDNFSQRIW